MAHRKRMDFLGAIDRGRGATTRGMHSLRALASMAPQTDGARLLPTLPAGRPTGEESCENCKQPYGFVLTRRTACGVCNRRLCLACYGGFPLIGILCSCRPQCRICRDDSAKLQTFEGKTRRVMEEGSACALLQTHYVEDSLLFSSISSAAASSKSRLPCWLSLDSGSKSLLLQSLERKGNAPVFSRTIFLLHCTQTKVIAGRQVLELKVKAGAPPGTAGATIAGFISLFNLGGERQTAASSGGASNCTKNSTQSSANADSTSSSASSTSASSSSRPNPNLVGAKTKAINDLMKNFSKMKKSFNKAVEKATDEFNKAVDQLGGDDDTVRLASAGVREGGRKPATPGPPPSRGGGGRGPGGAGGGSGVTAVEGVSPEFEVLQLEFEFERCPQFMERGVAVSAPAGGGGGAPVSGAERWASMIEEAVEALFRAGSSNSPEKFAKQMRERDRDRNTLREDELAERRARNEARKNVLTNNGQLGMQHTANAMMNMARS